MRLVTAAQMRAIDAAAVGRDGEAALMQQAGEAIAQLIDRYARGDGPVIAVAGRGKNGGDARAAVAAGHGLRETRVVDASADVNADALRGASLVLDGVLGVNARLPLDAVSTAAVRAMTACGAPVLALDVPTGIDPTTGRAGDDAVHAVATICFGRPKRGVLLDAGRAYAGDVWCAPLGMRDEDADGVDDAAFVMSPHEFAAMLPQRGAASDKRSSGAPLIVAGSTQFPGAAVLCAWGAARAGAGYVTVAAPSGAADALRAHLVEQVVVTYDEAEPERAVRDILDLTNRCNGIAIGPGMGLSDAVGQIVNGVIGGSDLPIVADASALYHLAKRLPDYRHKRLVITPHAGEFARISGKGTIAEGERWPRLRAFVAEHGITTLLKGNVTLIAEAGATWINPTGTTALATAGTGDVLTGMIATLMAQGLSPLDAARTGAYWHGRAGHVALAERRRGVIARDVADALGHASEVNAVECGATLLALTAAT